ncbi:MAG: recombinase [Steroidobacteraceae bacterium]|nr:recombinase [Deltaproteobacteria bacterium]
MDVFEQNEKKCEKIRKHNAALLEEFANFLKEKNLAAKTIQKHCSNVVFFINVFLLYEETIEAADGAEYIGDYLGFWFIRKAMWASPASIKENASSLKKFYQFMHHNGKIPKEFLDELKQTIKEEMPEWIATVERYDDPDIEDIW